MRFASVLFLTFVLMSVCFAGEKEVSVQKKKVAAIPVRITESDLDGSKPEFLASHLVLLNIPQKMQLSDGKMTKKSGKVIVYEKSGKMVIAFYRPVDRSYVLTGKPVSLVGVEFPRSDVHADHNVPCIVAARKDGKGSWRICMLAGSVVSDVFKDTAKTK